MCSKKGTLCEAGGKGRHATPSQSEGPTSTALDVNLSHLLHAGGEDCAQWHPRTPRP